MIVLIDMLGNTREGGKHVGQRKHEERWGVFAGIRGTHESRKVGIATVAPVADAAPRDRRSGARFSFLIAQNTSVRKWESNHSLIS
jgi:hypothetical protein